MALPEHPPPESPEISIVIATFDRPDALARCLDALALQQTTHTFEIVVVDNHPAAGLTAPLAARYPAARYPAIVWAEDPIPGLAQARNTGIRTSRAPIIVTTDDDVLPPPHWLETLTAPLFSPDGPAATTGNCLPLKVETEAERLFEAYGGLQHGPKAACFDAAWMKQWRVGFPHLFLIGTTANAAFRRSALEDPRIGPFETLLGAGTPAGAYEDLYCFYLMLLAGYRICYIPAAALRHAHRERMDQLLRQLTAYRRGETAFLTLIWRRHHDWRALGQMFLWIPQWRLRLLVAELLRRLAGRRKYPFRVMGLETLAYFDGPKALRRP
jgi:glycosyltransferase involved in cell wall biosynthesis